MEKPISISKSQLAERFNLHPAQLKRYMNGMYFSELEEVGYAKNMKLLPPKVVRKFIEIFELPLTENDFKPKTDEI